MGNGLKKIAKKFHYVSKVTFTHKERKRKKARKKARTMDGVSKKGPQCEVKGTTRMVMCDMR
jgi:hypothetical protein